MTRHSLAALVFGTLAIAAAPVIAQAQTFKVEKFDIRGDGGTDYVAVEAATASWSAPVSTASCTTSRTTGSS